MMNKCKVSCIVPIYNLGKKIERCVQSLLHQTFSELEIILIDDCSTDISGKIIDHLAIQYKNIVAIHLPENIRQGGAKNIGLKAAQGEYVSFIDGDDWVEPDMMETLYNCAVYGDYDVVDSDYYQEDEEGSIEERKSIPVDLSEYTNDYLINHPGRIWTKLFKRSFLINTHLFFIERKKFEDNPYLPIVFAYTNNVGKVNRFFYHYIYNDSSTSRQRNDYTVFDRLDTAIFLLKETQKRGIYTKFREEYNYKFINLYYINTIVTCITKFDAPPVRYIDQVYYGIRHYLPDFKKNKYIKGSPKYVRIIASCNLFSLHMLCKIASILSKFPYKRWIVKRVKRK